MIQIRLHGRGGQGVVTASELIAIAAFEDGFYAQAFPSFGVERTGAPIEAFVRIDKKFIKIREHVYTPNILIILDPTLLDVIDVSKGCTKKTIAIINTSKDKNKLNINIPEKNIYTVDATKIALKYFKKNLANTTILGAFAKHIDLVSINGFKKAIKQKFKEKGTNIINTNIKAIEESFNS